jgi:putative endonuclease
MAVAGDRDPRALGAAGEDLAAEWYERMGYRVVDRNWRCRLGEIDLVCRSGGLLVVCEVKTRTSDAFGAPEEAVTAAKQRRLRRLGARWLSEHRVRATVVRFDVVSVEGGRVRVIEDAF